VIPYIFEGKELMSDHEGETAKTQVRDEDTISLLDLIGVLAKRWKFIFFTSLIAAILIVGYSLYSLRVPHDAFLNQLPNIYKPQVEVRLQEEGSTAASVLGSGGSGLGALAGLAGIRGGGSSNVALAQELIEGNTIVDQIAEEFNFPERYEIEEKVVPTTRKMIREKLNTEFDSESGILTISFSDVDPEFSTLVVNRAVALLETRFRELTMEKVLNKKQFLEERLEEVEADLEKAQTDLIEFQLENAIVNVVVNEETKSVELVFARYIPQAKRHAITLQYFDLERDRTILEGIYKLLMNQYEQTKIEEMDDTKTFQILEVAEVPEIKDRPSRGKICIIVTLSAFFLSVFFSFIMEYFDKAKRDPVESEKLDSIKSRFRVSKKKK